MSRKLYLAALGGVVAIAGGLTYRWASADEIGPTATMRVVTQEQYADAIADIFGTDIKVPASIPPPQRVKGLLAIGTAKAVLTQGGLEQFLRYRQTIADQVVDPAHRDILVPCKPANPAAADPACAARFFSKVGPLLYRRPLAQAELDLIVKSSGEAADKLGDFHKGLSYALGAMLASPSFLFITETTIPDPAHPGQHRLDAHSTATRLSLLLWNAFPDEQLLKAADSGEILTPAGLSRQVDRMLASPRLEKGVRAFFTDMLRFEKYANLAKDPIIYPDFRPEIASESAEQILRTLVDHLVTRNGDYRDIFTTRRTFMSGTLGALYQVPVNAPDGWVPYEFAETSERAGILSQVGFLAVYSHSGRSSPTQRGRALRETFLCQEVPEPPPNVDFSAFEDPNAKLTTARERLDAHSSDPVCAGCHKLTDPIGLTLEKFDGAGQFRTTEKGAFIDASGSLDGVSFTGATGLARAMRDNPGAVSCLVSRLYAYGLARRLGDYDDGALAELEQQFAADDYRLPRLLRHIATSPHFTAVGAAAPAAPTQTHASLRHAR